LFVTVATLLLLLLSTASSTYADSATWRMNPVNGDWNMAANWTPSTVPNGPGDTATFAFSNTTNVSVSAAIQVGGIVFNAGASAFTITATPTLTLTISGAGITNNSGITQRFVVNPDESGYLGGIMFTNSATAGTATAFSLFGGVESFVGTGGRIIFSNSSSADHAAFELLGSIPDAHTGAWIIFRDNATAGNGTFTSGGTPARPVGGRIDFIGNSTAGEGIFINNGGVASRTFGGRTSFFESSTTGNATIINNAGTVSGAFGGRTIFYGDGAGNATLIANGGPGDGGVILFYTSPIGSTARVELFGNGNLDVSPPSIVPRNHTIGSIEGNGLVFLGFNYLTLGSNNLSTNFSGVIQDYGGSGASLTKIGTEKLVLSHRNTYTGGTTIKRGKLIVNNIGGSGTGSGPVQVDGGRLGGKGIIAGAVTVGTGTGSGAVLAPGYVHGLGSPGALTIQSPLTFNADATYNVDVNSSNATAATADEVVANGVTINSGAQFSFADLGSGTLTPGTAFTVINNTAATPIAGTFSNLPDGSVFTSNGNTYQVSYEGGDGNDLTLTVVP